VSFATNIIDISVSRILKNKKNGKV